MLYKILLRILGLSVIILYVYFRFFKARLPSVLYFYYYQDNILYIKYYLLFFDIFFISLSLYMLIQLLRNILNVNKQSTPLFFIIYFIKIVDFIKDSIISLYEIIAQKISYNVIRNFCMFFQESFDSREKYLIFLFYGLPYMTISLALFFDTVIYFTLYYFYKTLYLFVLPLIYNMLYYVMMDVAKNLEELKEEIDMEIINEEEIRLSVKAIYDPDTQREIELTDIPEYIKLYSLNIFLENLKTVEDLLKKWFQLFMYGIYLFCWVFIFVFNVVTLLMHY